MSSRLSGTWRRFTTSLVAFIGVAVGIPVLLVAVARIAIGGGNPVPAVGSASEVRDWFGRELSTTEVVPVVLRTLLVVSWLLWAALMSSVISALAETRPSLGHVRIPRLAMFEGLGMWIAAGLTVVFSIAPKVALAQVSVPSAFAPTVQIDPSAPTSEARRVDPVRVGYERVETGESVEMFAERTLGDGSRWTEIWELGRGSVVDPVTGTTWDEPWRLEGGWQLKLPTARSGLAAPQPAAIGDPTAQSTIGATGRMVEAGDSYWSIATDLLLNHLDRQPSDAETMNLTDALIARNAAHLGHVEPTMLHPGDVIDFDVDIESSPTTVDSAEHIVEAGDSYWSIATGSLWATSGERPAEADVFLLSQQLMLDNSDRLGYEDPAMLHPGDVVRLLPDAVEPPVVGPPPATTTPDVGSAPPSELQETAEPSETAPPTTIDSPTEITGDPTRPPAAADAPSIAETRFPPPDASATDRRSPLPGPRLAETPEVSESTTDGRNVAPIGVLSGLSVLSAAGLASLIRKRHAATRQRLRPGQRLAAPKATTRSAIDDVLYRDVSDVTWMDHELRLLAQLLDPSSRRRMTIELVQLGSTRTLEVAFKEVVEVPPPGNWTSVADRVWRLEDPHEDGLLADVQDAPPIAPTLVTLGAATDGGQIFLNLESEAGINVAGDEKSVNDWLANVLREVAGQALGEGSIVRLVADESFDAFGLPDGVEQINEAEALELIHDSLESETAGESVSMLDRRTGRWESWPSTSLILISETPDDRWDQIAASPSIAVLSTSRKFQSGLDVLVQDGTVWIPSLGIEQPASAITEAQQLTIDDVMESISVDAAEGAPIEPEITEPAVPSTPVEPAEDWEAPTWPVMINILGVPHATKNGTTIKLTPQQLSALALIATKREIPAHDFRRSIWGDEDEVSPERVRDMLSQLRKKVGGLRVIPKREDGLVCAGGDLGSDTLVFGALVARSVEAPDQRIEMLRAALDLVTGRVMDYSSSESTWWRWSEIAFGSTDWTAKTTDAAASLAQHYLSNSEPAAARDIAERGLVADPLNAALTELLMEAYADLGTLESAQRVYESHDRSLDMADLGGASAETRRVLERIRSAADRSIDSKAQVS